MTFMPILIKGEKLAENVTKGNSGGPKPLPYTYEEAKNKLINNISAIKEDINLNEELYLEDEIILSIRMAEGFLAKSYKPDLFKKKDSMEFVGARIYNRGKTKDSENKSKLYFIKGSKENIEWLLSDLKNDNFNKTEVKQLRSIEKLDLLTPNEKALGFEDELEEYEVEIVLHPLKQDTKNALVKIKKFLIGEPIVRKYDDGPIFILGKINNENVINVAEFNFLRTIHPIRDIIIPDITRTTEIRMPKLKFDNANPTIRIGVFDGGVNLDNPYIKRFVNENNIATLPKQIEYVKHGNAVCGAVLFGELNKYSSDDYLPLPKVIVDSFRVLPEENIYIIIDNIELIVKERTDIDIFNISFGPRGPILDDQINRFTYILDKLAMKEKLFCIAVGNDGDVMEPFNRIQAPSDSVNNLGVGAYSYYKDKLYRAKYSCIGIGREGGKIKPDLLAFGGDERNLFHAIGLDENSRALTAGTSFASPVVAGKLGALRSISKQINPLMARTLLVHTAKNELESSLEDGFGIIKNDVKDMINCSDTKVTVLYEGYILPTRCIKLPIPLPDFSQKKGKISFSWTITTLSDVDALDSDLYTNSCIEEVFYPNSNIFSFTKKGVKKKYKKNIAQDARFIEELIEDGYKQSKLPASDSGKYKTELERRLDMKWDTISRKYKSKNISSINEPFLVLQAINRDDENIGKFKFCVAITVEMSKYDRNLYNDILEKYKVLTPIEITQESEIEVEIS